MTWRDDADLGCSAGTAARRSAAALHRGAYGSQDDHAVAIRQEFAPLERFSWRTLFGWLVLLIGVAMVAVPVTAAIWAHEGLRNRDGYLLAFVLLAGIAFPLAVLVTPLAARQQAVDLRDGKPTPFRLFGGALEPWVPEAAELHWTSGHPTDMEDLDDSVYYLGESSSGAVIYATGTDGVRRLLRIPTGDAYLDVRANSWCPGWPERKKREDAAAPSKPDRIQVAVLKHEHGRYSSAECVRRQYPTNVWDCILQRHPSLHINHGETVTLDARGRMNFSRVHLLR